MKPLELILPNLHHPPLALMSLKLQVESLITGEILQLKQKGESSPTKPQTLNIERANWKSAML